MKTARKLFFILAFTLVAAAAFSQTKATSTGWKKDDFTTNWAEYFWEFDGSKFQTGNNSITFTYTKGAHKLCLKDATIVADGKTVLTDNTEKSAGANPRSAVYTFKLNSVPKKIRLTAKARTSGGTNSVGNITIKQIAEETVSSTTQSSGNTTKNNTPEDNSPKKTSSGGWLAGEFTENWKDYYIEFNALQSHSGNNFITYSYRSGAGKFHIKDVVLVADDKTIYTESAERILDANSGNIVYNFPLNFNPQKLFLYAKMRASGGTDISGLIRLTNDYEEPITTKYGRNGPVTVTPTTTTATTTQTKPKEADKIQNGILTIGAGTQKVKDALYKNNETITEIRFPESVTAIGSEAFRNVKGLKKLVIPGSVKNIQLYAFAYCPNLEEVIIEEGVEEISGYAFYDCPKLQSITIPKSIRKIGEEGLYWQNRATRVFHCYAGSDAYNLAVKDGYQNIDIIGIDEQKAASITEIQYTGNETITPIAVECKNLKTVKLGRALKKISAEAFRKYPLEMIDISNDVISIGKNAFHDKTILRVKRGTFGDKWARANGYYLCGVLADLNYYSKDKSKMIEEDFTRILCDDEPYAYWSTYSIDIQEPIRIEEFYGEIVLTSFMLQPCQNVKVTRDGITVLSKKTIQPLTRTVLCKADGTVTPESFKITSDDPLYQKITSIGDVLKWEIIFYHQATKALSEYPGTYYLQMAPVHCREYLAAISNHAYVIASKDFEDQCYKGVEKKEFYTDKEKTKFLTKEDMDKLLKQTRSHAFRLGRIESDRYLGLADAQRALVGVLWTKKGWVQYYDIVLVDSMYHNAAYKDNAFYHEFSHNMGWQHSSGNMCSSVSNSTGWTGVGSSIFKQYFASGKLPYSDQNIFNSDLFSYDEQNIPEPPETYVKNGVLYIPEGWPCVEIIDEEYKTSFTKAVIPSSASVINQMAFARTTIEEITIPGTIKVIEEDAFWGCHNLKTVVIEEGVQEIGDCAFYTSTVERITVPESVVKIWENNNSEPVTQKTVVWVVKRGSAAHKYAMKYNMPIEFQGETMADAAAKILKEKAEPARAVSWEKGDFSSVNTRRYWNFSSSLNGGGEYAVRFKRSGGRNSLSLSDVLFVADGKPLKYFPDQQVSSHIVYNITVPAGTKKLEMYALTCINNGNDSFGKIYVEKQ